MIGALGKRRIWRLRARRASFKTAWTRWRPWRVGRVSFKTAWTAMFGCICSRFTSIYLQAGGG
ncbi:unnamed protein product [Chondrus crispus]|uniref:Uncharacterized protein n=1 Tax=Chondrus crispus TaxID=2769 RepID=R7QJU6_CHOCR|nr:unnamed protein product [Chondrus crispus]CDF37751.1 unnamed protein product [Chondrus crispus]|eukprot:XP_005717622.1 unnamed protein product [Chondrus crispus]